MRYDRIIFVVLAAVLLVTIVYRSRPGRFESAPAASLVLDSAFGYVRISGAVRHPGMYKVIANKMAIDVIKMAIVVPTVAECELAQFAVTPVASGDAIDVRVLPGGKLALTRGMIPVAERLVLGIPLDINSMSEADFNRVPGIGPALAKRIVLWRHKNGGKMSRMDLISVEGIGEKKLTRLIKLFN